MSGTQPAAEYATRVLDVDTWDDFAALVTANNGVWGGCWCIGFHPEGFGDPPSATRNREAKLRHVRGRSVHQSSCTTVRSAWAGASTDRRPRSRPSRTEGLRTRA